MQRFLCRLSCLLFAPDGRKRGKQLSPLRFTLKQAVATSLQKSREISLARLQYETTRQETGVARSQFLS